MFELLLCAGSYYVYDNPAALQDVMISELTINTGQFAMFYSLYSWPNVILCFIGGFLIDRVFGVRWGAIIFGGIVTVGQVMCKMDATYLLAQVIKVYTVIEELRAGIKRAMFLLLEV